MYQIFMYTYAYYIVCDVLINTCYIIRYCVYYWIIFYINTYSIVARVSSETEKNTTGTAQKSGVFRLSNRIRLKSSAVKSDTSCWLTKHNIVFGTKSTQAEQIHVPCTQYPFQVLGYECVHNIIIFRSPKNIKRPLLFDAENMYRRRKPSKPQTNGFCFPIIKS